MNSSVSALRISPRLVAGLSILILGTLWTFDNLGILDSRPVTEWWPVILIAIGLARLTNPGVGKTGSAALVIFGALLLLDNLGMIDFDAGDIFPLAIAAVGAKLAWDALDRRSPRRAEPLADPSSFLSAFALMAGVRRQSSAAAFQGGDANAIMGGVELDLRNASIAAGQEAVIDAFAWWGSVEITVPEHWRVVSKVLPLLGGFDDKTKASANGPVLIVRGLAIMGAVEVKN